jgi:hypothetical protein
MDLYGALAMLRSDQSNLMRFSLTSFDFDTDQSNNIQISLTLACHLIQYGQIGRICMALWPSLVRPIKLGAICTDTLY